MHGAIRNSLHLLQRRPNDLLSVYINPLYTVKKVSIFPSLPGMSPTKLSLAGDNLIIPGQRNLVSDIPAGDRKIINLFYSVAAMEEIGDQCEVVFSGLLLESDGK
jgi:hypothetical protein